MVRMLRERGVTWARIGEALGMTRQSAWERFSGEE
jgi:ATP-dependent Clp protease ATP-binding subunit ClpX